MKLRNKKTGEVIEIGDYGVGIDYGSQLHYYRTIAEFIGEWEDYTPKEPLIKDERTRKAVRAWAEVNSVEEVLYAERPDRSLCCLTDMGVGDYAIEFVGWIPTLKDGATYTINELCGEEAE